MGFLKDQYKNRAWQHERTVMVEEQLKARGISDQKVLAAMESVPRELFVPEEYRGSAYKDGPLPIGDGQTISQPYMVALMTQCLALTGNERVLEIGTGSGYQMAVLLGITPRVYSIERLPGLAQQARANLTSLGQGMLHIRVGDGTCGWPDEAPFDGIIVTAGAQEIPAALREQLAEGGRLVIPVGPRYSQTLYRITRRGNRYSEEEFTTCVFVPLIGQYGWKNDKQS
jgi:protein-L-isoaspartate(D-aspartate) O-methyltransferase